MFVSGPHTQIPGNFANVKATTVEAILPKSQTLAFRLFAHELLLEAVPKLMAALNTVRAGGNIGIQEKGSSIVTDVDLEIQKIIRDKIAKRYPDHSFLGEEEDFGSPFNPKAPYQWIIDPVDGTSVLAAGGDRFGVSIALYHEGLPVVAAIWSPSLMPSSDSPLSGSLSCSCDRPGIYRGKKLIEIPPASENCKAIISGKSSFAETALVRFPKAMSDRFSNFDLQTSGGSAIAVASDIIKGDTHLYSTIGRSPGATYIWDIAAASYLLTKAGMVHLVRSDDVRSDGTDEALQLIPAFDWIHSMLTEQQRNPKEAQITMVMIHPSVAERTLPLVQEVYRNR